MTVKIIIRVDDIKHWFDFQELKKWFRENYPKIPVSFYACYTQYRYMWKNVGWKEIKSAILNFNWEIGGHSRRHLRLSQIPKEELRNEIGKNVQDIELGLKNVGLKYKVTSFAYPYGDFNDDVKNILKKYKIIHGLTYSDSMNYKTQLKIHENNLFEINISCNAKGSVTDWNRRFTQVFNEDGNYILCLHTSHWSRGNLKKTILKLLKSKSLKADYRLIRYYFRFRKEGNQLYRWKMLKEHIDFILTHPNVKFITFKDLIKS